MVRSRKILIIVSVCFVILASLALGGYAIYRSNLDSSSNTIDTLPQTGEDSPDTSSLIVKSGGTIPMTTGTFFVASDIGASSNIDTYLTEIKLLKMDTIIVNALQQQSGTCAAPQVTWVNNMPDNLAPLMDKARSKGIDVYLGLVISNGCSGHVDPNKTAVINATDALVDYIMENFGDYTNFKGWYIPDEPALAAWSYPTITHDYYKKLVDKIRLYPNPSALPIIVSPYLTHINPITPATVAQRALDFQNATGVTIQAWQDSVGGKTAISLIYPRGTLLRSYYQSISQAIGKSHFWVNNELFSYGVTDPSFKGPFYRPTSMSRLIIQYNESEELGSKNVVWTQKHQMGTVQTTFYNPEAKRLMDTYMAYYSIKPYKFINPVSYTWDTPPSATYPDTDNKELKNGITGDPKSIYDPAWMGFQNGKAYVKLNLDSVRNIRWVGFHMLHNTAYGVDFANNYKLSCSLDNVNWTLLGEYKLPINKVDGEYTFANNAPLNSNCLFLKAELATTSQWRWLFLSEVEIVTNY